MLEKQIERKVVEYAKKNGYLSFKFVSPSCRGVPDRIFINKFGSILFIEFKALEKKPTELQRSMIDTLLNQNCYVFVIDNVINGIDVLGQYQNYKSSTEKFNPIFNLPF